MFRKSSLVMWRAAASATVVLALAACHTGNEAVSDAANSPSSSPGSASSSPSASPTAEDLAKAAEADNVAEAKQRYLEFQEITTAHAKKGQSPFRELMEGGYLGSSDLQSQQQSFWEQYTDLKLKQIGEATVEVVEVTKYEGDPLQKSVTGHRVYMNVCVDNSEKEVVRPDGTSAVQEGSPDRALMEFVMQGQEQDGIWSVNEATTTGKC